MSVDFVHLLIIYFIFAAAGWLIELVFRSIYEKRPVNPGFHKGPWLPLYGLAGVVIFLVSDILSDNSILLRMVFYFILCTSFEFLAGVFLQRVFHKQYWDYSENRFNIKGLICPLYSFGWVAISILVELFILPEMKEFVSALPVEGLLRADAVLAVIFTVDFLISSGFFSKKYYYKIRGRFQR